MTSLQSMDYQMPATLTELLLERSQDSSAKLCFLNASGDVSKSLTYAALLNNALEYAQRLISLGLKTDGTDIVLTSFLDHESHITIFWACCLVGVPVCPVPPLHPDRSRQILFFEHLRSLLRGPTIIAQEETIKAIKSLVPNIKSISMTDLNSIEVTNTGRAGVLPAKRPTPDDIVCLMLTSGSTGNSKAVPLLHSNLLSSIRGKMKHHGTTTSSRFLNWISFDHVACVSEIHLQALAANASQYHVSPTAIIRRPRNLLDWCSKHRISYTFSPNFLLAQICRDVQADPYEKGCVDLACVQAFISGGEAVPIKTAVEFANILEWLGALRNVLRAGFGMTETGAGCIYDTRQIPRDVSLCTTKYLPLGMSCDGTSMRTVDPITGAICAPYQGGHLQVKGPTVFQEYFNNVEATTESFTQDGWFITGDTAQLDADGNLSLVGRNKDFLNINGIKHPSFDVEQYIEDCKIDGILKSSIYACPMRLPGSDTETYGIFYQHQVQIKDDLHQRDIDIILVTNRAIINACTVHCSQAPHVVLPLPPQSFVKTALGKISRSSLTNAYLQDTHKTLEDQLTSVVPGVALADEIPRTALEKTIYDGISRIFATNSVSLGRSINLFDMGASSMHLIQLKQYLQDRLSLSDLPTIEMLRRPEIGQLCDYLAKVLEKNITEQAPPEYQPLICFNPNGSKPPLFLVHPGVGEVLVFINLARSLEDDRPVYALRARGFDQGEETFSSFDEMVESYTSAIKKSYPSGPYFLAGYSFGGVVAFEVAKRLDVQDGRVAWLGIFNIPPYIQFRMNELVWIEVMLNLCMFLSLITTSQLEYWRAQLLEAFPSAVQGDSEPTNSVEIIDWVFERCDRARLTVLTMDGIEFRKWVRVAYDISSTGRTYEPQGLISGTLMTIFCAIPLPSMGTREEFKHNRLSAWKDFSRANNFEMVDVDGEHYTMLSEDHVASFSEKLGSAMSRAEKAFALALPQPLITPRPVENPRRHKLDFDEVPVIDFSLAESDPAAYYKQLQFALEDVGFGVFINVPGFEDTFQKELFSLAKALFGSPLEWKEALGTSRSYALRGYFRADDIVGSHKAYAEAYRFGADMLAPDTEGGSEVPFWLRLHEGPNQWPSEQDLPLFRSKMETLFDRYHKLNLTLNHHICRLLKINSSVLDSFFPTKTEFNSAIWHYFPVTQEIRDEARNGFLQGMHEHRDPSTFVTCLIQSRAGLQAQNHQGRWVDIPMVEGGVVCNIGMQLMKLTGGRLVATLHRVNTLKIEEDRYTIPYVLSTKLEKPVLPLPQFDSPELTKSHIAPNPRIQKLMAIEDPLVRSGFARLSLFPAVTKKLYPVEFEQGQRMGVL